MSQSLVQKIIFGLLMITLPVACNKKSHWEVQEWRGQGSLPDEPKGLNLDSAVQAYQIKIGDKEQNVRLQFQKQTYHDIEIEDAYYKQISVNGKPDFISYQWLPKFPPQMRADAVVMKTYRKTVFDKIQKKSPIFKTMSLYQDPQIILRIKQGTPVLLWKLVMNVNEGNLVAFYFDKKLNLRDQIRQGSGIGEAKAHLYPAGPSKSSLQEVLLIGLLGNDTLTSMQVRVSTNAAVLAKAENNQFIFPVTDGRFEQVQVYYYISQSLKWFADQFRFSLPFVLEAETAMGYPDKTNTAFYYQGKIRLGDGDEQIYSQIPLDPSIVMHESVHAVIDQVAHLPYDGEGGSLNEAFADYFAATQLNNPLMGEDSYKQAPFKRSIDNEMNKSELNHGLYHDSQIVSGLLWNLRKELGASVTDRLAWQSLAYLTPQASMDSFFKELNTNVQALTGEQQVKAQSIFKKRGWL